MFIYRLYHSCWYIIHCYMLLLKCCFLFLSLTFELLNILSVSATLACNVGLFQIIGLLIQPAALTPDLVQTPFLSYLYISICIYTYIYIYVVLFVSYL